MLTQGTPLLFKTTRAPSGNMLPSRYLKMVQFIELILDLLQFILSISSVLVFHFILGKFNAAAEACLVSFIYTKLMS